MHRTTNPENLEIHAARVERKNVKELTIFRLRKKRLVEIKIRFIAERGNCVRGGLTQVRPEFCGFSSTETLSASLFLKAFSLRFLIDNDIKSLHECCKEYYIVTHRYDSSCCFHFSLHDKLFIPFNKLMT